VFQFIQLKFIFNKDIKNSMKDLNRFYRTVYGTFGKHDDFFKTFEEYEKIWDEAELKRKIDLRQKKLDSLWMI